MLCEDRTEPHYPPELKHHNLHINNNRRADNCYIKTRVSARMNVKFYPFGFCQKFG